MYVYIYDDFLSSGKYDKLLHKVEKKLTDLGLNGRTIRLGISKNLKSAIDDEIRQGAKTIVAVGNDITVSKVINVIASNQSDERHRVCLGIIPLEEKESFLAKLFGIKTPNEACEVLLGRRLEPFRLGAVNNDFFLFRIESELEGAVLEIDKNFIVQPVKTAKLEIQTPPRETGGDSDLLSLKISEKESESSLVFKEAILVNKNHPIIIDGALEVEAPAKISLSEEKIKIIVGKDRKI